MPNYPGRRKGTRRLTISVNNHQYEEIFEGTKTEGDQRLAAWRLEFMAKGEMAAKSRSSVRFSEFCAGAYTRYAEANLRETTWKRTRIYQVARLSKELGTYKLHEINKSVLEAYKAKRRKQVGPGTTNEELIVLGAILNYAKELGHTISEARAKPLEVPKPRPKFWTAAELQRLFEEARKESPVLLRMLVFLANTGCRKGECIAAEWDWMDLEAGMIRIPSTRYWRPKNGLPREVPMSDQCRAVLLVQDEERVVFPRASWGGQHTVFPTEAFVAARDRAKLKGGVHTLRHTFASHFLKAEPDLFLLAQVLGHTHERVTELYSHLLPEHLERARNKVNVGPALVAAPEPRLAEGLAAPAETAVFTARSR